MSGPPLDPSRAVPVLFRDEALLAVHKPAGLASIAERDPGVGHLHARLSAEHGRLLVVHRLDKEVSGLLLFARSAAAHRALSLQFQARSVAKTYLALVHGELAAATGRIEAPLRSFGSGRSGVDAAAGKPSETAWRVLARRDGLSALALQPLTGRRHQLRAHLWSIGHPIAGDARYGDRTRAAAFPRLMLHALSVELEHPATGARLELRAEPEGPFAAALAALQALP